MNYISSMYVAQHDHPLILPGRLPVTDIDVGTIRNSILTSPSSRHTLSSSVCGSTLDTVTCHPAYSYLAFKKTSQDVIDFYASQSATPIPGIPKLDPKRVVDGQRLIQFLKPLPTSSEGKHFEIRSKVLGVYDKGKPGTVVETEQLIVDKDSGEVYSRAVGSGFFVGQGGWGGPKGPATENYPPPKDGRKPDEIHENQLNAESALLYR